MSIYNVHVKNNEGLPILAGTHEAEDYNVDMDGMLSFRDEDRETVAMYAPGYWVSWEMVPDKDEPEDKAEKPPWTPPSVPSYPVFPRPVYPNYPYNPQGIWPTTTTNTSAWDYGGWPGGSDEVEWRDGTDVDDEEVTGT